MRGNFFIAIVLISIMSGCLGEKREVKTLQDRLSQQQEEVGRLKSQLSNTQPAQAETWSQVQNMRQELSAINGKLDDFNHATVSVGGLQGLAQRVKNMEDAIRKLEQQFDIKLLDKTKQPDTVNSSTIQVTQQPMYVEKSSPKKMDPAMMLYDSGIKFFNERKYKEALASFSDFIKNYSSNKLISNAWFWRGEVNYQLGNYPAAALDYEQVISKFPKSRKIASAYLKQGLCFYRTGKKDAAKFRLEEVAKKFPSSPEAKRAKQILQSDFKK